MEPQDEAHETLRKAYHVDSDDDELKGFEHIEVRELLIQYPQIHGFLAYLLNIARAGGLSKAKSDVIFDQIVAAFGNLRGDSFFSLRDGLIRILVEDDYDSEKSEESEFPIKFRGKNPPESLN